MKLPTFHKLIWALIYGGLLGVVFGLAIGRSEPLFGNGLAIAGGVVASVGFSLIWVRSRIKGQ